MKIKITEFSPGARTFIPQKFGNEPIANADVPDVFQPGQPYGSNVRQQEPQPFGMNAPDGRLDSIPGGLGEKYYTIQRVNGNGGNGKGDGVAGPHKHTLEESDRVKKNSIQRQSLKEEKVKKKSQVSVLQCPELLIFLAHEPYEYMDYQSLFIFHDLSENCSHHFVYLILNDCNPLPKSSIFYFKRGRFIATGQARHPFISILTPLSRVPCKFWGRNSKMMFLRRSLGYFSTGSSTQQAEDADTVQSAKKTYHKKATGAALVTAKRHAKEHNLKLYGSCFWYVSSSDCQDYYPPSFHYRLPFAC